MTNRKSTKRALLVSVLSLVLCFTMLIGTTFAWFTDSVTSANNIIMSGNLDIELEYWNGTDWVDVNGASDVITGDRWEPGYVDTAYLRIKNAGSLALKYKLGVNIVKESAGVNAAGNTFKLSDYIYYDVVDGQKPTFADRAAAMAYATESVKISTPYVKTGELEAETDYVYLAMLVYMPETVGNVANHNGTTVPKIELGINIAATQLDSEFDSFGPDYDEDTIICDVYATPANIQDVIAAASEGTVIGLRKGVYGDIVIKDANGESKKGITLTTNAAIVASVNLNGSTNITLDGITFDTNKSTTVWGYSAPNTSASDYVASITDASQARSYYGAQDIKVVNCTFKPVSAVASHAAGKSYVCIGTTRYRSSQESKNFTIENCVFECNALNYVRFDYVTSGNVVIKNNVFGGAGFATSHNSINATSTGASWTIEGNTFNAWNPLKTAIGASRSSANGVVTWTVNNNVFNGAADTVALALKARDGVRADAFKSDNTVVVFEGNTALNGNGVLVDTTRNAEDDEDIFHGKKIALNAGVKTAANATDFKNAIQSATADETVVLTGSVEIVDTWDRYSSNKSGEVTIDGCGNKLTIVSQITCPNYQAAFRFDSDAVVKNVVFDFSNANPNGGRFRAISCKGDLVVENCTFIGNSACSNTRGIIFGEGSGAGVGEVDVKITNCTFIDFTYGITDNENGQDAKSVIIENNKFVNANVQVSATDSITFTGNEMDNSWARLYTYTAFDSVVIVATGNTLCENGGSTRNTNTVGNNKGVIAAANVTKQDGFVFYGA